MFLAKKLNNGAGTPAAPVDAKFNYVTMLLHGDGTNGAQNNTFLDSSTNNFTITRNGNTTQGSFSPYGSNWSALNNGVGGNYLSLASNSALNQSGNLTIEMWVFLNATPTLTLSLYGFEVTNFMKVAVNSARKLVVDQANVGERVVSTNAISLGTWAHICLVRNGTASNNCSIYINGGLEGQFTDTTTATASGTGIILAKTDEPATRALNGYVSNLRVTNTAVYTAAFTPSTTPLTAISGTSLLTCQSNRFRDASANNFTITVNGTAPSVQRFNPFGTATAYSTSVIGGSGYFDGSGDYLDAPSSTAFGLGTSDFTYEAWVYPTLTSSGRGIIELRLSGNGPTMYLEGGVLKFWRGGSPDSSGVSVSANSWSHVSVTRQSGTLKYWINGVQAANTATVTDDFGTSNPARVGSTFYNEAFSGYISNARVVKGTAVYTSNFTPSTSPLTAISGTSLLLQTTNAGIFDNAMMNDLETVGNAQISTSVVKYGTGSLYFDGTGDYLTRPYTDLLQFGSGNFTIECWAYLTASSSDNNFIIGNVLNNDGSGGYGFLVNTSRYPVFYFTTNGFYGSGGSYTATTQISFNTWSHIAVTRSGLSFYIFVDGVLSGTNTSSATIYDSTKFITIGSDFVGASSASWTGYIDDLRITKGYARYTATFTPPIAAFPNIGPV